LGNACGKESEHYKAFNDVGGYRDSIEIFVKYRAVFNASKEDYLGGYCNTLKDIIEAEGEIAMIDFSYLNETEFEELCYDLIAANNFINIDWKKGTGLRCGNIIVKAR
jgi:hypothetical protein